jgi:histo-blood group ABO system transferase
MLVAINQNYWPYAIPVIQGIRQLFMPGHQTTVMLWSDVQNLPESAGTTFGADKVFRVESVGWPYPTLMRYHMFLNNEEELKDFDYLFYIDLDMRIVDVVGDEILGDGLTGAQHPMYAVRKEIIPPYEPNPESAAFIPRPGKVIDDNGRPRFLPLYFAGGFQGGKTMEFIAAMKAMKEMTDHDLSMGYIPIWNDESIWNRYLFDHPPSVVLSPSYVYPDSMHDYYRKVWGRDYTPRVVTLTKPFSLSKEGGAAAQQMMQTL